MTDKPKFKLRSKRSRIDIISQNGNDGLHYEFPVRDTAEEAIKDSMLYGTGVYRQEVKEDFFEKDYLDQKRQMMEESEQKNKWFKVLEKYPPDNEDLFVIMPDGCYDVWCFRPRHKSAYLIGTDDFPVYWMKPNPPKEEV